MIVYVNGELKKKEEAMVNVFDHGFLYGDGIFEGIRVYRKNIFRLKDHIERLYKSAHSIMLKIPLTEDEMIRAVEETAAASGEENAYIRLVVSRGTGALGIDPKTCPRANVVIIVGKIQLYPEEYYAQGIPLVTSASRRLSFEGFDPQIKSLNYLNNILAKMEAHQAGCMEALMLNKDGYLSECTADNIFFVRRGKLLTPSPSCGILRGITRDAVIELAGKRNIEVIEGLFTRFDAYTADECFMTGTGAEIMPISAIDGRTLSASPGPITRTLIADFKSLTGA